MPDFVKFPNNIDIGQGNEINSKRARFVKKVHGATGLNNTPMKNRHIDKLDKTGRVDTMNDMPRLTIASLRCKKSTLNENGLYVMKNISNDNLGKKIFAKFYIGMENPKCHVLLKILELPPSHLWYCQML